MLLDTKNPSQAQVDSLLEEWNKDAKMDRLEPSKELQKVGSFHSKYLSILSAHRRAFKETNRTFAKLKRLKYEYYSGRLDQETLKKYNWSPFPYTLKADINIYMDSDPDVLNAKRVIEVHEEIVEICESVLKELNGRTFQLRDIIQWERFISGQ